MTRPFDLVVLDLDGTILDLYRPGGVSPAVRETIAAVQASGIPVTIATGRVFDFVRDYVRPLGIVTPVVTTQGAVIGDPVSGHVLFESTLSLAQAREIAIWADATQRPGALYFFDGDGRTHIRQNIDMGEPEFYDHVMGSPREIVGALSPLLGSATAHPPIKFMMVSDQTVESDLSSSLQEHFGAGVTVTRTHPLLVEITAAGVDKGAGIRHLCEYLGVDPQRVLAVGDNENDIPMLRAVGYAVAMGNGTPAVHAVANWVAPTIDEDGAAVALRRFVLAQSA